MLGMHRITYSLSEKCSRDRDQEELEKLSLIFDIPLSVLLDGSTMKRPQANPDIDEKMFKNIFIYILNKVGIKPNIGKTTLYKLLYFADFDHYEKYGTSITGTNYIKLPMWPAPYNFDVLVHDMVKNDEILVADQNYGGYYQKKYFPNKIVESKELPDTARAIVDDILSRYADMNASEISNYSHGDVPRLQTKDMEIIDYSLANSRHYPYSILAREQKKQETQAFAKITWFFEDLADEPDLYEDYR